MRFNILTLLALDTENAHQIDKRSANKLALPFPFYPILLYILYRIYIYETECGNA